MLFYAIRQMFLKGKTIKDAIFYVFEQTGNMPTKSLGKKIIDIYKDEKIIRGKRVYY